MEQHFYKTTIYTPNGIKTSGFWWPPKPEITTKPAAKANCIIQPPAANSSTGLASLVDFVNEAKRLDVLTPPMKLKFEAYFTRKDSGDIGEGMCRMQCNALIKNAVKRK